MNSQTFADKFPLVRYAKSENIDFSIEYIKKYYRRIKKNHYIEESLNSNKKEYFFDIQQGDDFGVKTTFIALWIVKNWSQQDLIEIISLAHFLYPESQSIEVCIPNRSSLYKKIKGIGFNQKGFQFFGLVDVTASRLDTNSSFPNLRISKLKWKDHKELANVMYLSHSNSKTSFAKNSSLESSIDYLKMCKTKFYDVFIGKINDQIICSITPIKNSWGVGHIMDICIHPDFKGLGISKLLYKKAMDFFKSKQIEIYSGCSSSKEVIQYSKKLKREKSGVFLSIATV